jgi:apolipoprotein N-acyltransferase
MYYWIYNVMAVGPPFVIMLGLSLLIIFFSLINGYLGFIFKYFQDSPYAWLGYAVMWAGLEVARTRGQMSFPWNNIGYTLGGHVKLIQVSSLVGIFGLSFIILVANLVVFQAIYRRKFGKLAVIPLICLVLFGFGLFTLEEGPVPPTVTRADVCLVQPSIKQTRKWDEKYFHSVMRKTFSVIDTHDITNSDLVLMAETAVPAFLHRRPGIKKEIRRLAVGGNTDIVTGSLDFTTNDHPGRPFAYFNSAFLFSRDTARPLKQYSKLNLVPFSERLPFDDIFPVLNYVNLGEGDFCAGKELMFWGKKFIYSPSICYEVVYPRFVRSVRKGGAELLVNITNDGWFGNSTAPYQHANICRFRAIESGIPIARCANSGISLFYDYKGRTIAKTELFSETVLRKKFPLLTRNTAYQSIGGAVEEGFFWLWVLGNAVIIIVVIRRRYRSGKSRS